MSLQISNGSPQDAAWCPVPETSMTLIRPWSYPIPGLLVSRTGHQGAGRCFGGALLATPMKLGALEGRASAFAKAMADGSPRPCEGRRIQDETKLVPTGLPSFSGVLHLPRFVGGGFFQALRHECLGPQYRGSALHDPQGAKRDTSLTSESVPTSSRRHADAPIRRHCVAFGCGSATL
jgi:hypothetical protein